MGIIRFGYIDNIPCNHLFSLVVGKLSCKIKFKWILKLRLSWAKSLWISFVSFPRDIIIKCSGTGRKKIKLWRSDWRRPRLYCLRTWRIWRAVRRDSSAWSTTKQPLIPIRCLNLIKWWTLSWLRILILIWWHRLPITNQSIEKNPTQNTKWSRV